MGSKIINCKIAAEVLKKNKQIINKMDEGINKKINKFQEKTLKSNKILNEEEVMKLENLLKERQEFVALNKTLQDNDFINQINKKQISDDNDLKSVIEESISKQIESHIRGERVYSSYIALSEKMLGSKQFKEVVTNIEKGVKSLNKANINEKEIPETKITKVEKDNLEVDEKTLNEGLNISYNNVETGEVDLNFFSLTGKLRSFMGILYQKGGNSSGAKNLTLGLFTNNIGVAKNANGDFVRLKPALDKKLRKIMNETINELYPFERKIFEEATKDIKITKDKFKYFKEKKKRETEIFKEFTKVSALRQGDVNYKVPDLYKSYFKKYDEMMSRLYELEKNKYGVDGFIENYSPISHNADSIKNLVKKYGLKEVAVLYEKAILKKLGKETIDSLNDLQLKHITTVSQEFVDKITKFRKTNANSELDIGKIFNEMLETSDLETMKLLASKGFEKTKQKNHKTRIEMDYSTTHTFTKGSETETISVIDLLQENSFASHTSNMIERFKKVETEPLNIMMNDGKYKQLNIFDDVSVENFMNYLKNHERVDEDYIDYFYSLLPDLKRSQFIEVDTDYGQYLRTMRNFTTATMLGTVILPSIVEGALVMANIGIGNFLKQHKEYKILIEKIKNGDLSKEEENAMIDLLGVSSHEAIQNRKVSPAMDSELNFVSNPSTTADRLENISASFSDFVVNKANYLSGFTGMTRGIMVMGYVNNLSKKTLSESRALEIGWTKSEANFFHSKLKSYGDISSTEMLDKMKKDLTTEQYNNFEFGILTKGDNMVLNPNIGEGYYFLNKSPIGKVVFQFQTYITNAFTKMLINGIKQHDAEFFIGITTTTFMSSIVEMVKDFVKGGTDEAIKDYKEGNLIGILTKAMRNNSFAANVPYYSDLILNSLGINTNFGSRHFNNKVNNFGDIVKRIPVVGKIDDTIKLGKELKKVVDDGDFSSYETGKKFMKLMTPDLYKIQTGIKGVIEGKYND